MQASNNADEEKVFMQVDGPSRKRGTLEDMDESSKDRSEGI